MFDSELFEISEKAVKSIDKKSIQKRNREIEKKVLKIIKKHSSYIDENGISHIMVYSNQDKAEYEVLHSIITSGRLKYYEEEYSLYLIGQENVDGYIYPYDILTFLWNSIEYNMKNKNHAKNI